MPRIGITQGQNVTRQKLQCAKELRQSMTPQEQALWERLRHNQLDGLHFRRQQVIDGFVADFYCRRARLVIELDGAGHAQQVDYDRERDKAIAVHDLTVLRISNDEFDANPERILSQIRAICDHRIGGM